VTAGADAATSAASSSSPSPRSWTERLVVDLGFDALGDPAQVAGFAAMLDPATKPFECVGTVEEVRLALDLLAARPTGATPQRSGARRRARAEDLDGRLAVALAPDPVTGPPAPYDAWLTVDRSRGKPDDRRPRPRPRDARLARASRPTSVDHVLVLDERHPTTRSPPDPGSTRGSTSTTRPACRRRSLVVPSTEVVRSPGVSPYRAGASWLVGAGADRDADRPVARGQRADDLVAITGTKGKSTVAAMTAHLLRAAGREVVLAGNIGVALTTVDPTAPRDDLVVELSSYQLADLTLTASGRRRRRHHPVRRPRAVARQRRALPRGQAAAPRPRRVAHRRPQVAGLPIAAGRSTRSLPSRQPTSSSRSRAAGLHGPHQAEAAMLALALAERRLGRRPRTSSRRSRTSPRSRTGCARSRRCADARSSTTPSRPSPRRRSPRSRPGGRAAR
jgi:hypothetical protein